MYAIKYRYPGTENGKEVGWVYALDIKHICGDGCWSYEQNIHEATHFMSSEEAERERRLHTWPFSEVVHVPI